MKSNARKTTPIDFFRLFGVALIIVILIGLILWGKQAFNDDKAQIKAGGSRIAGLSGKVATLKERETIDLGGGVKMEFVLIRPGSFIMGSDIDSGDGDETPLHKVTITQPFYLGQFEVTQRQWEKVMGGNPSKSRGAKLPVDSVSWNDCRSFLAKLPEKTGRKFALPTEAQWEFACRAGTATRWSFGDNEAFAGEYGWIATNSGNTTHPAGGKKPNPWGLYDMYGNVWEWCADWYANPYPGSDIMDPQGPSSGVSRVLRGGAWGDYPVNSRSACRNCNGPDGGHDGTGFRCVMVGE